MPSSIPPARVVIPPDDRSRLLNQFDEILASGRLTNGNYVQGLEQLAVQITGRRHAVATNSGTSALQIILQASGVADKTTPPKEVILPTNTFAATAFAVLAAGAVPRFADLEPAHLSLSPETVEPLYNERTAAVITMHTGGIIAPDIHHLRQFCNRRNLMLIEDAAHAWGSRLADRYAGDLGHAAAVSLFATKVVTSAEGGLILTNDGSLAEAARILRDQGKLSGERNFHTTLGYNWRMSELHAALGQTQIERTEEIVSFRQQVVDYYVELLDGVPDLYLATPPPGNHCNYYKLIARLGAGVDRQKLKRRLRDEHLVQLSGEVYAVPLHQQPIFISLNLAEDRPPLHRAEEFCNMHICLPIYNDMTRNEVEQVAMALRYELGEG